MVRTSHLTALALALCLSLLQLGSSMVKVKLVGFEERQPENATKDQLLLEIAGDENEDEDEDEDEDEAEEESQSVRPKFLLGIFSVLKHAKEEERRQVIRETYLSHYKKIDNQNSTRICSLSSYQQWKTNNRANYRACQLIYAFVVGADPNPKAPTNLCNLTNDVTGDGGFYPVANNDSPLIAATRDSPQNDFAYLNIKENMNDGKTPSWYKYAIHYIDQDALDIDYIAKLDTDMVFFPDKFIEMMNQKNLPRPNPQDKQKPLVFAGFRDTKTGGTRGRRFLTQDFYMLGFMNFLSVELARHIISVDHNQVEWYKPAGKKMPRIGLGEDLTMSNLVFSHPNFANITILQIAPGGRNNKFPDISGRHGLKDPQELRQFYEYRMRKRFPNLLKR